MLWPYCWWCFLPTIITVNLWLICPLYSTEHDQRRVIAARKFPLEHRINRTIVRVMEMNRNNSGQRASAIQCEQHARNETNEILVITCIIDWRVDDRSARSVGSPLRSDEDAPSTGTEILPGPLWFVCPTGRPTDPSKYIYSAHIVGNNPTQN